VTIQADLIRFARRSCCDGNDILSARYLNLIWIKISERILRSALSAAAQFFDKTGFARLLPHSDVTGAPRFDEIRADSETHDTPACSTQLGLLSRTTFALSERAPPSGDRS
jgi:hypothetical protein